MMASEPSKRTPRQIEEIKKKICKVFSIYGLKITIEANKKTIDFLDVTLDLNKGSYEPYTKPNNTPFYVHRESNHPPSIIQNIPVAINRRLNDISSNRDVFDKAAPTYQQALKKSGYDLKLDFDEQASQNQNKQRKKSRRRNITWFNPPYSRSVSTNVGRKFFNIVNQCFKPEHPLRKIFNKNTLKLSYSCMPNLAQKISAHNKSVLKRNSSTPKKPCNCRVKQECPLNGNCQARNIIYQASVKTDHGVETYVGLTGDHFKSRFRNHTASFRDQRKKNATELSKHIWELKNNNTEFTITWKILA